MTMLYSALLGNRGATGSVQLVAATIEDAVTDPSDATASISFEPTGGAVQSDSANYNWLISGNAADFDIKATITAGSFSTGTSGSWLNLASNRGWTVSRTTIGSKTCTATFEISRTGQATAIDSATITLTATVEP